MVTKNSSEKTLLPKEVSVLFTIQSRTVLLLIGKRWKKSGIIVISMNSESNQKTTTLYLLKPQETQLKTEKECAKFSSKISKFQISTFLSKLSSHSTPPVELLVVLLIVVMVFLTPFQSSKVTLSLTVSKETILPEDNFLTLWLPSSEKLVTTS